MTTQEEQEVNELKKSLQEKKISLDEHKRRLIEVRLKYRKQQTRPRLREAEREKRIIQRTRADQKATWKKTTIFRL